MLASLIQLETSKLFAEEVNMWKCEGYVSFNIAKDGDSKYHEVWLFVQWKKGVIE
jgi:HSP90 family molecular chaperone